MFITKCPGCNVDEQLTVSSGVFIARGMALCNDGFSFREARNVDTEDEIAECRNCKKMFNLDDLYYEDAPPSDEVRVKIKEKE